MAAGGKNKVLRKFEMPKQIKGLLRLYGDPPQGDDDFVLFAQG